MSLPVPRTETNDEQIVRLRAEWLHLNNAPPDWLIITKPELDIVSAELTAATAENARLRADIQTMNDRCTEITLDHIAATKRNVQDNQQLRVELDRWKSLAVQYSAERESNANMAGKWKAVSEKLYSNTLNYCRVMTGLMNGNNNSSDASAATTALDEALTAYQKAKEGGV